MSQIRKEDLINKLTSLAMEICNKEEMRVQGWNEHRSEWDYPYIGSFDACLGFIFGATDCGEYWLSWLRIVCADVVVWPEDFVGHDANKPPNE